jgi:hypothetical protein
MGPTRAHLPLFLLKFAPCPFAVESGCCAVALDRGTPMIERIAPLVSCRVGWSLAGWSQAGRDVGRLCPPAAATIGGPGYRGQSREWSRRAPLPGGARQSSVSAQSDGGSRLHP